MGRSERAKGIRAERALVNLLDLVGIKAHRVPLSGAHKDYPGDLIIPRIFKDEPVEVKYREDISSRLWQWLDGRAALFLKKRRHGWIVVMRLPDFLELVTPKNHKNRR